MRIVPHDSDANKLNHVLKSDLDDFLEVAKALSTELRLNIFKALLRRSLNVNEIADEFGIPPSTAAINIKKLEDAGLILTEQIPGTRGIQKLCSAVINRIVVDLTDLKEAPAETSAIVSLPIGQFVDSECIAPCGMLTEHSIIGELDEPRSFFEPDRTNAQLLWFRRGYVEYRFPNRVPRGATIANLELSMEICSEAPLHHPNWPSDITLWVNGEEVGTWTSPGDFGGERGILTPEWWATENTQYGLLKQWRVNTSGSYIDGRSLSGLTLDQLALDDRPYVTVRLGIKPGARNDGGLNLFGRKFGNYETDLILKLDYVR